MTGASLRAKRFLYGVMYHSRAFAVLGRMRRAAGAILMFHRVVPEAGEREFQPTRQYSVTPDVLADVIEALRRANHEIVSLDEAELRLRSGEASGRFACLTFDDGYRDNAEIAYPVCASYDAPMTTYVTTGFLDGTDPIWWYGLEDLIAERSEVALAFGDRDVSYRTSSRGDKGRAFDAICRRFQEASREDRAAWTEQIRGRYDVDIAAISRDLAMTWDALVEFGNRPGVEIGAHSVSHRALSALTEDEVRHEIAESRRTLEARLSRPVRHFAYPFGDSTTTGRREFEICRELGFTTATTTRHGLLRAAGSAMHSLPRVPTDPFESAQTIAVKLSGLPGALRSAGIYGALNRVRRRDRPL